MKLIQRFLGTIFVLGFAVACAGPNYYFDDGPSPDWTRETTSRISSKAIRMVGTSPVTSQTQRDQDLAVRDAKAKIGQLFVSQVKARSTDWTLALQGGEKDSERLVLNQQVEVRTNVKVEGVKVASSFRDEATRTQFVVVTVDRRAWSKKIKKRVLQRMSEVNSAIDAAQGKVSERRAMSAYQNLLRGSLLVQEVEQDLIVVDLLDPQLGLGKQMSELIQKIAGVNRALSENFSFVLSLKAPNSTLIETVQTNIEEFLNGYGFSLSKAATANTVQITAEIGQKHVKKERVGNRTEFIHAATGLLRVTEPDGSEVRSLSLSLNPRSHTERDTKRKMAAEKALQLAADTITSKFRSQFRQAFPRE